MRISGIAKVTGLLLGLSLSGYGQLDDDQEVPLMRPDEKERVESQADGFNEALAGVVGNVSKSTVRIWGMKNRRSVPEIVAYGTVIGDGSQVLSKWSEIEGVTGKILIQTGQEESFETEIAGVYTEDDLVLLKLKEAEAKLQPVHFETGELKHGNFLIAPQPTGRPGAFGVVSVEERNLRETDRAHLGVIADRDYQGVGVRLAEIQPGYGADEAGLRTGDVILEIGGRKISGLQELRNALADKRPGDVLILLIEAAGKERKVEVKLSSRPLMGQFSGDRLNAMERMGGELSKVRNEFSSIIQSDMKLQKNQVGGPVVNLDGKVVGVTVARADRTRTYLMGSEAIKKILAQKTDTVAEAKQKDTLKKQELASQRRSIMPQAKLGRKPRNMEQMRRNIDDLSRLLDRANEELEALEDANRP